MHLFHEKYEQPQHFLQYPPGATNHHNTFPNTYQM